MFFQHIAQGIFVHHYHFWHVALAFLVPCVVLVFAGTYIVVLRTRLRDTEEENTRFKEADIDLQKIGTLLQIVNTAHERNQRDAEALKEANAQVEKHLADIATMCEQQLQDAARLQDGAAALKEAQTALFGVAEDKDPFIN